MPKSPKPDDVVASVAATGHMDLSTERPRVDGPEDHRLAKDALAQIGRAGLRPRATHPEPAAPPAPKVANASTFGAAKSAWIKAMTPSSSKKTLTIKAAAVEDLVHFMGERRELHTLTRPDLAKRYQHLRDQGIADPTLTNKQSYVGGRHGFFAWAIASGRYPARDASGKGGCHSLRNTVIQELKGNGVASEMRAQIVGHELDDEHHAVYSREFMPREKLSGVRSKHFSPLKPVCLDYALRRAS